MYHLATRYERPSCPDSNLYLNYGLQKAFVALRIAGILHPSIPPPWL